MTSPCQANVLFAVIEFEICQLSGCLILAALQFFFNLERTMSKSRKRLSSPSLRSRRDQGLTREDKMPIL